MTYFARSHFTSKIHDFELLGVGIKVNEVQSGKPSPRTRPQLTVTVLLFVGTCVIIAFAP